MWHIFSADGQKFTALKHDGSAQALDEITATDEQFCGHIVYHGRYDGPRPMVAVTAARRSFSSAKRTV